MWQHDVIIIKLKKSKLYPIAICSHHGILHLLSSVVHAVCQLVDCSIHRFIVHRPRPSHRIRSRHLLIKNNFFHNEEFKLSKLSRKSLCIVLHFYHYSREIYSTYGWINFGLNLYYLLLKNVIWSDKTVSFTSDCRVH